MQLETQLAEAASYIQNQSGAAGVRGLVILGSGLGDYAESLTNARQLPYASIPHFQPSTVQGHAGQFVVGEASPGLTIACMQGRFHYYEGHSMNQVVFPVRVAKVLGAEFLLVTNAAGGVRADLTPGSLMLIEDHLNLMGDNPLRGNNPDALGPRFPDMSQAYSGSLRRLAAEVAAALGIDLKSGVYAGLSGPSYETPAEVRMIRALGGDAVGMSTVPEVIAANHLGMQVLGLSCITNQAAGLGHHPLSHAEVMETATQTKNRFMQLLSEILKRQGALPGPALQVQS